jgi:ferredoxin
MLVHLTVDPDVCIGSAECVALDPEAIELDDQGCARPLLSEMDDARARRLCDACPVGALAFALQPSVANPV